MVTASSSSSDWRFENRLPWPGVRGRRLWRHISGDASVVADTNSDADAFAFASPASAARYDVEQCETTAGHVALVLLRRESTATEASASAPTLHPSTPTVGASAAAAAQLAIPRVLIVVDAVAPKPSTAPKRPSTTSMSLKTEPKWTMLSTRAHSFGGQPVAASASPSDDIALVANALMLGQDAQDVDELALVEELFMTTRATKDSCILTKPPMLCARFDCRLVGVRFTRSATGPLRCVVAREDGMCYLWEWSGDLQQWSFLNRFCFLDNSNLKWTRPVRLFTTVDCTSHSDDGETETTELAWWSAEAKTDPKLFVRKLQYGVQKSTFRTEIRIGSAFQVATRDVAALRGSRLGLWIVSRVDGVSLRSAHALQTLHVPWTHVLPSVDHQAGPSVDDVLSCVHSTTSELVLLHRPSKVVVVVFVDKQDQTQLHSKHALTLDMPTGGNGSPTNHHDDDEGLATPTETIAAHRQFLLALHDDRVNVWSLETGTFMTSLKLPNAHWTVDSPLTLWTSTATRPGASTVGLYGSQGYWRLQPPSAHALAAAATTFSQRLRSAQPHGATLEFDAASFALDLLQSARQLVDADRRAAWDAAVASVSSPALLVATLSPMSSSPHLVDALSEIVSSVYHVTHEILITGRFASALDKRDDPVLLRGLPYTTPANVEALHHLANWVLLAKRKLARLQGTATHKGQKHLRVRAVSAVTTLSADDAAGDDVMPVLSPLELHDDDDEEEDDDAASSRLSRKLRPMTGLQFAAGSTSVRHGRQWLEQLDSLLLAPPRTPSASSSSSSSSSTLTPPHALLFHEERTVQDFQVALSSFSKHMYFESMARLFLLHDPPKLLPFVERVATFAPQLFTLSDDHRNHARSHAERALLLLPPSRILVDRVKQHERREAAAPQAKRRTDHQRASAKATLLAYAELLRVAGHEMEACSVLLDAELYDESVAQLDVLASAQGDMLEVEPAVVNALFFAVLEYCVAHRREADLEALLHRKPRHVDTLVVFRMLSKLLPRQVVPPDAKAVSVGGLRKVLMRLLQAHRAQAARAGDCVTA